MSFTPEYLDELKVLHSRDAFGKASRIPNAVVDLKEQHEINSILDFGCGKGNTSKSFKQSWPDVEVHSYDPVMSPIEIPSQVDLVYSSDVLEHVEPNLLDETINHLFSISNYQYHLIACHPAKKALSDGRNAHLIIEEPKWWLQKFEAHLGDEWEIISTDEYDKEGKTKKMGTVIHKKFIIVLKRK